MTRIAHVTDLHFGATDPAVVEALTDELNAGRYDLVAISGDLTMGARGSEFRAARAFIEGLSAPALAVPGNHDVTPYRLLERLVDPWRRWRAEIARETEPVWSDGRIAVVGLNTARRAGPHWDWSRGRVTQARLRQLIGRFEPFGPDVARVVVAHHPLLSADGAFIVGGARRAIKAFEAAGVRLVLSGHLHVPYVSRPSAGLTVVQGGTATSVRTRGAPNAYNRVTIGAGGETVVEGRVWDGRGWVAA